jgi:uncharacterized membrane protein YhaH (DUF805 family)
MEIDAGRRRKYWKHALWLWIVALALAGTATIIDFTVDADFDAYLSLVACGFMVAGIVWTAVRMRQAD